MTEVINCRQCLNQEWNDPNHNNTESVASSGNRNSETILEGNPCVRHGKKIRGYILATQITRLLCFWTSAIIKYWNENIAFLELALLLSLGKNDLDQGLAPSIWPNRLGEHGQLPKCVFFKSLLINKSSKVKCNTIIRTFRVILITSWLHCRCKWH